MFDKFITKTKHNAADTLGMDVVLKHGSDYGTTGRVVYGTTSGGSLFKDPERTIPVYSDEIVNAYLSGDLFVYLQNGKLTKALFCDNSSKITCYIDRFDYNSGYISQGNTFFTVFYGSPRGSINGTWKINSDYDLHGVFDGWTFAPGDITIEGQSYITCIKSIYIENDTMYMTYETADNVGDNAVSEMWMPGNNTWIFNIDESKIIQYSGLHTWLNTNATKID